ncbi:hypothetical protein K438DRAFT_1756334 [Mycena galopus ATCC 62051]|nr:hypothetical protein K438DRAFT_1756334 [Mycena galopus ATCC 62051]
MMPNNVPGQVNGPTSPDNWKRAVYRMPPSRFTVEMLPPVKLGGNYNFQMRICPIARADRSSVSSRGSNTEYEILRRWEDCSSSKTLSNEKYPRSYSPPDEEGHMFRASQAMTDQRQAELTAFIAALWMDDVPTLLEDFRKDRMVTDFFGFWRRDQDIQKTSNAAGKSRSSVSSSVFSTYFSSGSDSSENVTGRARALSSASSDSSSVLSSGSARSSISSVQITLDDQPLAFGHNPHQGADNLEPLRESLETTRKGGRGGFLSAVTRRVRKTPADEAGRRERPSLDEQPARPDSRASNATTNRLLIELVVNRAPRESWQTTASGMTFMNDLNLTLPDDADDSHRSRMSIASIATFRTEVSSEGVMGVMPRFYVPEPNPARLSTASFMTDVSADAIIPREPRRPDSRATMSKDLAVIREQPRTRLTRKVSLMNTSMPPQQSRPETPMKSPKSRQFSASSASLVPSPTTVSIDPTKIQIPSSPLPSPAVSQFQRSKSPSLNVTPDSPRTPVYPRKEFLARARSPSPNGSVMSASMSIMSEQSSFSDSTGSTITPSIYSFYSARSALSSTTTASSVTAHSSSSASSPLIIKAAHNNAIILLRAEEDLSLREMRRRLREKFLGQENVALSESFTLAYMIPASPAKAGRNRSNSVSSASALSDGALVEKISTEADWARLRSSLDGAKLTLRVIDGAAS